jgi:hypothetical protein
VTILTHSNTGKAKKQFAYISIHYINFHSGNRCGAGRNFQTKKYPIIGKARGVGKEEFDP